MSLVEVAQAMVEGAILGSYQFTAYRSEAASGQDVAGMRILIPQKGQLRQVTEGIPAWRRHGRGNRLCPRPL